MLLTGMAPHAVAGQDSIAAAKELYRNASFTEALARFDTLRSADSVASADRREIERYRAFCLIALDRMPEAVSGIEAIIMADPSYLPSDTDVSPRVHAVFHDIRPRVLPRIASDTYAAARRAFDRKEYSAAAADFERALALLDDPDMDARSTAPESVVGDLAVLTPGFIELSRALASASQQR
jgi:tetratricopeptide (TPR) repeat protein